MDENGKSVLALNEYCKLEIIKYIISDCESRDKSRSNRMKYLDLVSFALAHEDLEAVLKHYYSDLYEDLEFLFVANRFRLDIDFAELATHTGKAGDVFWRFFADAIKENSRLETVDLVYKPESFQPDFLDHFQMIKRALKNKNSLLSVDISLNGYSLDDLNNFGHLKHLLLDVRMSAEALVSVCQSNPELDRLSFLSTEIQGRLSEIVPHCRRLRYLEFAVKPDVDGAEYAPLAQLPNLEVMTIHGAFKNVSQLTMLEAMQKWKRSDRKDFIISFNDELPHLSSVAIVRNNAFRTKLCKRAQGISIRAIYKFMEISKDTSSLKKSLAIITLIDAELGIDSTELTLYTCSTSAKDIIGLMSILKLFHIETLIYNSTISPMTSPLRNAFGFISMALPLISVEVNNRKIDQPDVIEFLDQLDMEWLREWEKFSFSSISICEVKTESKQAAELELKSCHQIA